MPIGQALLSFTHDYDLEPGPTNAYDGGVLEIKIGTNAFTDILAAGGTFLSGGYVSNIYVKNYSGAALDRLLVTGNTFGLVNATGGNDNFHMEAFNSTTAKVTVSNNTFAGTKGDFVETIAQENSTMEVVVRNNDFNNGQAIVPGGGTGVSVRGDSIGTAATGSLTG